MSEQPDFFYWEPVTRKRERRPAIYETPDQLWADAVDYFNWVNANPLRIEEKASSDGQAHTIEISRPRPMTIAGLCVFLGIGRRTWDGYRDREEFLPVISHVEDVMRTQKFEWAVAGAMNANLISRDLGLADKHQMAGDPDNRTPVAQTVTFRLCGPEPEQPKAEEPQA